MFSQLSDQVKISSQPVSDLFAANVKALQAVADQQSSFVSGFLTDSIKLMKAAGEQTEAKGLLAAQGIYAESVRERLTSTSKNTFSTLNVIGQQFANTMRSSFESANAQAVAISATVPALNESKKAPVAKKATTASKAAVATKTTVAKKTIEAKKTANVKTESAKSGPSAASAKKVSDSKATVSKPVVESKVAVKKSTAANVAAKPVPEQLAKVERVAPKAVTTKKSDTTSKNKTSKA